LNPEKSCQSCPFPEENAVRAEIIAFRSATGREDAHMHSPVPKQFRFVLLDMLSDDDKS